MNAVVERNALFGPLHKADPNNVMPTLGSLLLGDSFKSRSEGRRFYFSIQLEILHEIHDLAGITEEMRTRWRVGSFSPAFFIDISDYLAETIEGMCIYQPAIACDYYLKVCKNGALYVNYQHIIGSRKLIQLTDDGMAEIKAECAALLKKRFLKDMAAVADAEEAAAKEAGDVAEQLGMLIADGNMVCLPEVQLSKYGRIKVLLEQAGAKYSKGGTFVFDDGINAADVLAKLIGGDKINPKKETQSFFTPRAIGEKACAALGDIAGKRLLEPSAGDGAMADIARAAGADVVAVESYASHASKLRRKGYNVLERDFLALTPEDIGLFDAILANPPFTRNQDIDHVMHMLNFLKPGGTLSAITSASWMVGSQKKQKAFAALLEQMGAQITEIEAGAFKESGTTVSTLHIVLTK